MTDDDAMNEENLRQKIIVDEVLYFFMKDYQPNPRDNDAIVKLATILMDETKTNKASYIVIDQLSGGYTNYSYKVSLANGNIPILYAKLALPFALFNDTIPCNLDRTQVEFRVLQQFRQTIQNDDDWYAPSPVVKPYFCKDVTMKLGPGVENNEKETTMKLLVTEWSQHANVPIASQFADGAVDPRVIVQLARALALLHGSTSSQTEGNVIENPSVTEFFVNEFPQTLQHMLQVCDDCVGSKTCLNRIEEVLCTMGKERCNQIVQNIMANYSGSDETSNCLIHGDYHVLNILVEETAKVVKEGACGIEIEEMFGRHGAVVICDWEGAVTGPRGRDIGVFLSFPLACVMVFHVTGQTSKANHISLILDLFWETYAAELRQQQCELERGMDLLLRDVFESAIGWCGWFLFDVFYRHGHVKDLGCFIGLLPLDKLPGNEHKTLYESIGAIGLRLMESGFGKKESSDPHASLEESKALLNRLVCEESVTVIMQNFLDSVGPEDYHALKVRSHPSRRRSSACSVEARRCSMESSQHLACKSENDNDNPYR